MLLFLSHVFHREEIQGNAEEFCRRSLTCRLLRCRSLYREEAAIILHALLRVEKDVFAVHSEEVAAVLLVLSEYCRHFLQQDVFVREEHVMRTIFRIHSVLGHHVSDGDDMYHIFSGVIKHRSFRR